MNANQHEMTTLYKAMVMLLLWVEVLKILTTNGDDDCDEDSNDVDNGW